MDDLRSRRAKAMGLDPHATWEAIHRAQEEFLAELGVAMILDWEPIDRFLDAETRKCAALCEGLLPDATWEEIEARQNAYERHTERVAEALGLPPDASWEDIGQYLDTLDDRTRESFERRYRQGEFGRLPQPVMPRTPTEAA